MNEPNYNLDCEMPDDVASVLRYAAEKYFDSASELESAWQDGKAGRIWEMLAKELERCANHCETLVKRHWK